MMGSLLLLLLPAVAPQATTTIALADVQQAKDAASALALARRVLPGEAAARIVEARVARVWLPGQIWWIGAIEPATAAGKDLCERTAHSIRMAAPSAAGDTAPGDTVLTAEAPERWSEIAVMPIGVAATPAACAKQSFVGEGRSGGRAIAAYRVLRSAMAAAGGTAPLPFGVTCNSEAPAACQDARKALASLPLDALRGIGVSCLEGQKIRNGNIIRCPPLVRGQPYQAEVRFGPSGNDGRSWTVAFVHRPGWPATVDLRRTTIIYH